MEALGFRRDLVLILVHFPNGLVGYMVHRFGLVYVRKSDFLSSSLRDSGYVSVY